MSGMIQGDKSTVYDTDDELRAIICFDRNLDTEKLDAVHAATDRIKMHVLTNHAGVIQRLSEYIEEAPTVSNVLVTLQENKDGVSGYLVTIEMDYQHFSIVFTKTFYVIDVMLDGNNYGEGSRGNGVLSYTDLYTSKLSEFGPASVLFSSISS